MKTSILVKLHDFSSFDLEFGAIDSEIYGYVAIRLKTQTPNESFCNIQYENKL